MDGKGGKAPSATAGAGQEEGPLGGGGGGGGACSAVDYPELHVVFDFFTDNPQKMLPTTTTTAGGEFASSGSQQQQQQQRDNPLFDPYWESIRLMQENELFLEGTLLKSVDCKHHFPYLHYIIYKSAVSMTTTGSGETQRNGRTTPDHAQVNARSGGSDAKKQFPEMTRSQGGYCEMNTFVARGTALLPKRPSNPNTAYIVSAFKTAGNLDSLDRTWTYWSGADYIVENIPRSLRLERVTFHKLKHHHGAEREKEKEREKERETSFSYVLLCEVGEALADVNRAREFIDSLKYRQCGVTSMYVIDHFF